MRKRFNTVYITKLYCFYCHNKRKSIRFAPNRLLFSKFYLYLQREIRCMRMQKTISIYNMERFKILFVTLTLSLTVFVSMAGTGTWKSSVTGTLLNYTASKATTTPATDANGKPMTIVYLENLGFQKIGQNSNADDVAWLRGQGYQVIELDYANNAKAKVPGLNQDIIAINSSLQNGKFCGQDCSTMRSYILMEGYRICRDVSYYHDDPTLYNYPDAYKSTQGDSLYMDIVYPANPQHATPVLLTFSYSNSYATDNKHKRMYLPYFWGAFNDSFVEGASAVGFAWAVCDHPKYCDWGQGKYTGGANKSLATIEVNPDAARKVKSAVRTVRGVGRTLGLSEEVAVTGFSRGSTAAALAVGDGWIDQFEDPTRGRFAEESSLVQCALLGSGMFDYHSALSSSNEYTRMKAYVEATSGTSWEQQGALATITGSHSAPTLFFYNSDDFYADKNKDPKGLYATQAALMKEKLNALGVETKTLTDYSSGHGVPQSETNLQQMYTFLMNHVATPTNIQEIRELPHPASSSPIYNLGGQKVSSSYKGIVIRNGRKILQH